MSGIELAGLVLGAFPIALWGLEQYRDVAKQVGFWAHIRSEYQQSINDLDFHRLSFEGNLKLLLLPFVDDEAQLEDMIAEPGGPAWKNAAIQQALENRLQKAYTLYLAILADMERVMGELNKELALENDYVQARLGGSHEHEHGTMKDSSNHLKADRGRATRFRQSLTHSNREFQLFRVKFTLGKEKRTELFGKLETHNSRLEKLTNTSDAISQLQTSRQAAIPASSVVNTALLKFWNHADRLYRIMMEAWNCSHDQHCAKLVLQHRSTTEKEFRLGLSSIDPKTKGPDSWATCAVKIKMQDRPEPQPVLLQPARQANSSTSGSAQIFSPHHKTKAPAKGALAPAIRTKKAHASINTTTVQHESYGNTMTVTLLQEEVATMDVPSAPKLEKHIQSLCSTLAKEMPPSHCIGYMQDDDIRYYLYFDDSSGPQKSEVQLSQILCGEIKPPLTRRQRYHLALTLASSFVQLKDSLWMQASWGKDSVYFARGESDNVLFLDSPYITHNFSPSAPGHLAGQKVGHDIVTGIVCLGIILMELLFNKAIEHHPSRAKFPPTGDERARLAFDQYAAREWLQEVDGETGSDYKGAVEWCIAGCHTAVSSDGKWRKTMLEKVVGPLESAINNF